VLPIVIIGGMKFGVFTPTEAAVVAVVYAFVVGMFVYGELKFSRVPELVLSAAKTSSTVLFLVACALVSAWLITIANIPAQVTALLEPFVDNPILLMFVIMVLVIIVGTALDLMPTVLIMTPILMPVITKAGIDPVYFGVMFIMNNAIGLLTPPVGTVLNVVAGWPSSRPPGSRPSTGRCSSAPSTSRRARSCGSPTAAAPARAC
jgi:tripartite ATP-independent transporter DctM subunit